MTAMATQEEREAWRKSLRADAVKAAQRREEEQAEPQAAEPVMDRSSTRPSPQAEADLR